MKSKFFTNKIQRQSKNTTSNLACGFTLIELMVATTLFTVIMLMGVGTLIISSNSARSSHKLRVAVDNVNFAMESMTRELRTGSHFYCSSDSTISMAEGLEGDCSSGKIIVFTPQEIDGVQPPRAAYVLQKRDNYNNTLRRCEGSDSNCSDIVSTDVSVKNLKFFVNGSPLPGSVGDKKVQPSVMIIMNGVVKSKGGFTPFYLQSMASQRSSE